ncbi:2-(1,2-epoxy-1,2-dihydrophenyl)acetyl-CoA isomerase [Mitsuaria sp. BK045]|uniref:enoyl-CoA hydratase-related protein n=1 Tax=unclassified Roseateles TaxID=2626991 RepID=UPI00161EE4E9|nr:MULTISPECIES: enoyl-CoA hydratase-related protein [unclassified Roseateles]MBB3294366.1 2-(1,2-epoxy-1,2-dihydrophenyl)acetyl-CoA isomerase [Mitsuaria sp. BK041]MBB3363582.1 2-(1,2-epoxy-1,2-dihydrophenyl)acetyl-CoA isomerase [Mitsuaria sp. BK045]
MSTTPTPPSTAEDSSLLISTEGAVRVLTLNRPQALNAFTTGLLGQLRIALDEAAHDEAVRAVLITGAGRAFCAGQDLSDPHIKPEFDDHAGDADPQRKPKAKDIGNLLDHYYIPLALRLRSMPVPTVCAVNGVAAGAGANFALGCDLVLAGQSASFIQAFSKIGLVPDCGGTWLLTRLVGRARALQLALLGDKLPAADAQAWGLIARCVADGELQSEAMATAQKLAKMPTRALVQTRQALDASMDLEFEDALKLEAKLQSQLGYAHDYLEGAAAFLSKRAPVFKDR